MDKAPGFPSYPSAHPLLTKTGGWVAAIIGTVRILGVEYWVAPHAGRPGFRTHRPSGALAYDKQGLR